VADLGDYLGRIMTKLFGSSNSSWQKNPTTGQWDASMNNTPGILNTPPKINVPQPTATPSPTPTAQPSSPLSLQTPVFPQGGVATESARPQVERILSSYVPKTPDVPQGYKSPLLDYTDLLASLAGQYGLDPRLLPLLAISETQGMRPAASGTARNNPFNTMEPGTQNLIQYPSIEEALRQYAAGVAGPETDPTGQGLDRYLMFRALNPQSTLQDFVNIQNPIDNPDQQLSTIMQIASQYGF